MRQTKKLFLTVSGYLATIDRITSEVDPFKSHLYGTTAMRYLKQSFISAVPYKTVHLFLLFHIHFYFVK